MNKLAKNAPTGSRWRRYWNLRPGVTFLNHGSFGACPGAILALQHTLRRQMEAEPVQFLWRKYDERLDASRRTVAAFVNAKPADLVFVPNATTAVNAVVRSLDLRPGEQILTTSHDYNACRNVLAEAARKARAELVIVPVPFPLKSEEEVVEAVLGAVTRHTRFAMIDHVTSSTGLVLPVARLLTELEHRGVEVLVDGAHAPGMVPLNLTKLGASWYTGNLHKWVCAPKGSGFLWARPDKQSKVQPAIISHGNNTPRRGYNSFQDRFDWSGTMDPTPWMCAGEAIEWMGALLPGGWRELRQRNRALVVSARRLLISRLGVQPPCPESMLGSLATLPLPQIFQGTPKSEKIDAEQLRLYDEFRIEVMLYRCGIPERRCFRISAQIYNSLPQYEYLAGALEEIANPSSTRRAEAYVPTTSTAPAGLRLCAIVKKSEVCSERTHVKMVRQKPKTVDEYIAAFSPEVQEVLRKLRTTIKKAAPGAEETINYQIPTFTLKGNLVHFAAFKEHIGFYPTPSGIENFKGALSDYECAKGSVRFPLNKPLPVALVSKIVKFRAKENLKRAGA